MATTPSMKMWESVMAMLGLNQPGLRFLTLFTMTNLLVWLIKPGVFFEGDGDVDPKALFPWWTPGVMVGGAAALFL